ncbi:MAG: LamG-like jellyroll fold domain-containing protein [Candidatus Omnitrophota bacterium]|nr:LamG-like jellyroll fold domain-containing protein [Candidatus Omnitrophota bacterium]
MIQKILSATLLLNFLLITSSVFAATDWCASANTKAGFKMQETSGVYLDCSSNSNNGTIAGTVTRGATGKYANGVQFTQSNNADINISSASSLNNIDPISVALWANNNSDGDNSANQTDAGVLIQKNGRSWLFAHKQTNKLRWLVHYSGGNTAWDTTTAVVGYGVFEHYAVTHNRAGAGVPTFYVNGVSKTVSGGTPFGTIDDDSGTQIFIGISGSGGVNELDSTVDELLVYGGILTSTDVNEVKDNGLDGLQGASDVYSGRGMGRGIGRGVGR